MYRFIHRCRTRFGITSRESNSEQSSIMTRKSGGSDRIKNRETENRHCAQRKAGAVALKILRNRLC